MKTIKIIFLLVVVPLLCMCSNDFLNENEPNPYELQAKLFVPASNSATYNIEIPANLTVPNASFTIRQYPDWITVYPIQGNLSDNILTINVEKNADSRTKLGSHESLGNLYVQIERMGLVKIAISSNTN